MLCMRVARQSTVRQKIMEDGRLWIRENKMEIFALRDLAHTHTHTHWREQNAVHLMRINTEEVNIRSNGKYIKHLQMDICAAGT